jgi:hypothetical protein
VLRRMTRLVMSVLAFGALLVTASPTSASASVTNTADTSGSNAAPVVQRIAVGEPGVADYRARCFGYVGTFRDGTAILVVDWNADGTADECFGIAPNRTIWHAWPNSRRWHVMPHNGRADDTWNAFYNSAGQRTVQVYVNPGQVWCSSYRPGGWQRWVRCG